MTKNAKCSGRPATKKERAAWARPFHPDSLDDLLVIILTVVLSAILTVVLCTVLIAVLAIILAVVLIVILIIASLRIRIILRLVVGHDITPPVKINSLHPYYLSPTAKYNGKFILLYSHSFYLLRDRYPSTINATTIIQNIGDKRMETVSRSTPVTTQRIKNRMRAIITTGIAL